MSFINPITDFNFALNDQGPEFVEATLARIGNQSNFEDYWKDMIDHIQKQIQDDTSLDITPLQKDFLLTLLTNCADNAVNEGREYEELHKF